MIDAKKTVAKGTSPALEKQREQRRLTAAKTFGDMTEKNGWPLPGWPTAPRRCAHIIARDILPAFQNRKLNEITAGDLRALCNKVKGRVVSPLEIRLMGRHMESVATYPTLRLGRCA